MATDLFAFPAVWGLCGALFYSGMQLTTALWGGETAPSDRARKRAYARFGLAIFFGPVAAAAMTTPIIRLAEGRATIPAVGLAVGLSANILWPLFVEGMGLELRKALAAFLKRIGAAIDKGDPV